MIYTIDKLIEWDAYQMDGNTGMWVPARPIGSGSIFTRLHAVWLVLTGKADAVVWS